MTNIDKKALSKGKGMNRSQKEERRAIIIEETAALVIERGAQGFTYRDVCDRVNETHGLHVAPSSVQAIFPKSTEFVRALDGKVLGLILKELNFDSKQSLIDSFREAARKPEWTNIFSIILNQTGDEGARKSAAANSQLGNIISEKLNLPLTETKELLILCYGNVTHSILTRFDINNIAV